MKIVWKHAPVSTNEITDRLVQSTDWSPKTVQTLIRRLVTKEVLTYEKKGRVFVYTPAVKEDEYLREKSSLFLNRYFGGDIMVFLSSCPEADALSDQEMEKLEDILLHTRKKSV